MAIQKFRPVLTSVQLTRISELVSQSSNPTDVEIKKIIVPMLAKISVGAITPSYSISPESEQKRLDIEMRSRYNDGLMTPEEESRYEREILGI